MNTSDVQLVEFTAGQWEEMRRQELNWLRKQYGPRGQRAVKEVSELDALAKLLKGANFAEVGIVFYWDSQLLVSSIPWKLSPVVYGFHNYLVSHQPFWKSLQGEGKVPQDITYDLVPRGRITFNEITCAFTLLADRCIVQNKVLVITVMKKLNLPPAPRWWRMTSISARNA